MEFDIDDVHMQSDIDSEEETFLPNRKCQNCFDLFKFIGILIYQVNFCLMIGYLSTSNFAS